MEEISIDHPYCQRLREIPSPPKKLYVLGDPSLLGLISLAIVGTRQPSAYGLQASFRFANVLARKRMVVVSGLARGIDTAAHNGALAANGLTIAVLGHGLDRVYPARNLALADSIVKKGGCLVSEYAPGTPPLPPHFPARNRIISGLSLGTLVVEAAKKSGSLITARFAAEQGRDVFVVPGRFDDFNFEGGHSLIQQGAKLVRDVDDILMEFAWLERLESAASPEIDEWNWVTPGTESLTLGEIQARSGWPIGELAPRIEAACTAGWIMEVAPQSYLWVGPEKSFHPAPCQN